MITLLSRRVWLNKKFSLALFKEHHHLVDSEQYEACDGEQVYVSLDDVPFDAKYNEGDDFYISRDGDLSYLDHYVCTHDNSIELYSFDDCEVDYSTPLARAKGDNDDKQSVHTEMV